MLPGLPHVHGHASTTFFLITGGRTTPYVFSFNSVIFIFRWSMHMSSLWSAMYMDPRHCLLSDFSGRGIISRACYYSILTFPKFYPRCQWGLELQQTSSTSPRKQVSVRPRENIYVSWWQPGQRTYEALPQFLSSTLSSHTNHVCELCITAQGPLSLTCNRC